MMSQSFIHQGFVSLIERYRISTDGMTLESQSFIHQGFVSLRIPLMLSP